MLRYAAFNAGMAAPVDPPGSAQGYSVRRPKKRDSSIAAAIGRPDIMASAMRRSTTDQPAPDRNWIEMKSAPDSAIDSRYTSASSRFGHVRAGDQARPEAIASRPRPASASAAARHGVGSRVRSALIMAARPRALAAR